jgi:hypothetical protein
MIKLIINFPFVMQNDSEKRQTSQGYIIRILQHFAKLRNITNFVMLVQAVMKFLSRLVWIKISIKRGKVYSRPRVSSSVTRSQNA